MDVRRNQQQDRALAADARVEAFASALERVLPVAQDDAPAPLSTGVGEIAQDTVIVAGRVCSEVDGKLSEVSVQLEGSIARSGGASVTLDLGQCPRFSIFPGQCVAVKGINPTGQRFIAQEITSSYPSEDGAPGPLPESEIVVIVASGPFTATPGEDSPALERVLFIAAEKHASVVVLMGPFVDAEHAVIKEDQLGERYEDVQLRLMRSRLLTALKSMPETEFVMVPSPRDALAEPVLPQPPMASSMFGTNEVDCRPNPCVLSCGGEGAAGSAALRIGCVAVDVVKHLAMAEISRGMGQDRIARLCQHLIDQRSFYPISPPPLGPDNMPLAFMESTQSAALEMKKVPHVIVTPSALPPFVKTLSCGNAKVLCINPGAVVKGQCAVLSVSAQGTDRLSAETMGV